MCDRDHIKSLERGLRILEIFAESSRSLTLTEVATSSNLSKTSAHRFLKTLCSLVHQIINSSVIEASKAFQPGF